MADWGSSKLCRHADRRGKANFPPFFPGLFSSQDPETVLIDFVKSVIIGVASAVQVMGSALPGELFPNNQRYLVFVICTAGFFPLFTLGPGIGKRKFSRFLDTGE